MSHTIDISTETQPHMIPEAIDRIIIEDLINGINNEEIITDFNIRIHECHNEIMNDLGIDTLSELYSMIYQQCPEINLYLFRYDAETYNLIEKAFLSIHDVEILKSYIKTLSGYKPCKFHKPDSVSWREHVEFHSGGDGEAYDSWEMVWRRIFNKFNIDQSTIPSHEMYYREIIDIIISSVWD